MGSPTPKTTDNVELCNSDKWEYCAISSFSSWDGVLPHIMAFHNKRTFFRCTFCQMWGVKTGSHVFFYHETYTLSSRMD